MKFLCLLVIYNKNYQESESYRSIISSDAYKNGNVEVALLDNSVKNMHNEEINDAHFTYLSMHGNKGLSAAYNRGLDFFEAQLKNNAVVLLDDDTKLSVDYFSAMKKSYGKDADIFLPIIYDQQGQLLSPSIMGKYRCVLADDLDQINSHNINGINTGMMIKGEVFEHYRYDEHYFLDYVDHAFIRDMKKQKKKMICVHTVLSQNYSLEGQNYQDAMRRYRISKKDISYYYQGGAAERLVYHYLMLRRKAKYFKMYKKINVFFK